MFISILSQFYKKISLFRGCQIVERPLARGNAQKRLRAPGVTFFGSKFSVFGCTIFSFEDLWSPACPLPTSRNKVESLFYVCRKSRFSHPIDFLYFRHTFAFTQKSHASFCLSLKGIIDTLVYYVHSCVHLNRLEDTRETRVSANRACLTKI